MKVISANLLFLLFAVVTCLVSPKVDSTTAVNLAADAKVLWPQHRLPRDSTKPAALEVLQQFFHSET